MTAPIPMRWEGDAFRPMPRFADACDKEFVVGQVYRMVEQQDRSSATHAHFFACINDAWDNLPDHMTDRFSSPEHLRKFALIKAGFADSRQFVAASKAEALRLAAFVRPCDDYSVVTVNEAVVTVYTAQSQSMKAMGKQAFQASKQAVLDIIAGMIGTTSTTLAANAGKAS